ncbi:ABC transporter ATP-binding protein [Parafrankia sp. EUN1f]|uniref:ABC transporter ATP-binding protein n=1 Tax=Parafrankia sp. EUN1f TaxID=102897 RepID=UPI0001C439E0|nr:ABC transporter ATP-binding protein [Parafrankia sp. EUN1f]EFC85449.1 ABC transporter related protein [Parafrankia sp. EUN1f]
MIIKSDGTGLVARIGIELGTLDLDAELAVQPGRTLAVLGPNGAGKSTLLRALAGLVPLRSGQIVLNGVVLDQPENRHFVSPEHRGTGYVFQDYLLFPHLNAIDNVAFGPRVRHRVRRGAARAAARQWLARLGLTEVAHLRPNALSGGQAQRVALARALAPDPGLLLLDEPLAALDAGTRLEVRAEIRALLPTLDVPVVLVTHDPVDALTLADDVAVLERGRVVQRGTPVEVITRPHTPYVARLAGLNLFPGTSSGGVVTLDTGSGGGGEGGGSGAPVTLLGPSDAPAGKVLVALRPSDVGVHIEEPLRAEGVLVLTGPVTSVEQLGDQVRVQISTAPVVRAEIPARRLAELRLVRGTTVWLTIDRKHVEVYSQTKPGL